MNSKITTHVTGLLAISLLTVGTAWGKETIEGQSDRNTGRSTRSHLAEQAEGKNRAETEPYRAESAGKAYRAYVDSIGQKAPVPESQIDKK
ncbi:MAG: hypothetical protein QE278_00290 [Limnobacter sp.]|nr:hypothetical protein [Limnobacter sp.]